MVEIFSGCGSFRDQFGRANLGTPHATQYRIEIGIPDHSHKLGQLAGPILAKNIRLSRPNRVQANVTGCD